MKNKILFLFFFVLTAVLLAGAGNASALEIKNYPAIPGLVSPSDGCTGNDCLSIFIGYWFGLLIYIAGIIALISFTVGAASLIFSMDNAETQSNAKDRMKGAVLGLLLVMVSYTVLRTININLISPVLTPLPGVGGVYYKSSSERRPIPPEEKDTASRPEGFNEIEYACLTETGNEPALLIWKYSEPNFSGEIEVERKMCGQTTGINFKSFKLAFETSGVYFCTGECGEDGIVCKGNMSNAYTNDIEKISDPFRQNIKSVRIVNSGNQYYGFILHDTSLDEPGQCTFPVINDSAGVLCDSVSGELKADAADIFLANNAAGTSGDGITLYSEPFGWDVDNRGKKMAGFWKIPKEEINWNLQPFGDNWPEYNYTDVNATEPYKEMCKTFQDCAGSIDMKGNYLVGIYSKWNNANICQTFNDTVPNLWVQGITIPEAPLIDSLYIIPLK